MPTGYCPMPLVCIPHIATRKNPAASSPFYLPPCLLASGLGALMAQTGSHCPTTPPQTCFVRIHPPSKLCSPCCPAPWPMSPPVSAPWDPVIHLALTPQQPPPRASSCPSASARPIGTHSSGSLQGWHPAPCLVFLSLRRDGICELVSMTQRRRGTESAVRRPVCSIPSLVLLSRRTGTLGASRDEPFPCGARAR